MTHYFKAPDGNVLTRSSKARDYTHAILIQKTEDGAWTIGTCCGRKELADKQLGSWSHFHKSHIAEASLTEPKQGLIDMAKTVKQAPKKDAPAKTKAEKAKSAPKAKAENVPKAPKEPKVKEDGKASMADKLMELAQRKSGVTTAELNEVSGWKGAPWKWLFQNPKGTGWCDRRNLTLTVTKVDGAEGERKQTVYQVS